MALAGGDEMAYTSGINDSITTRTQPISSVVNNQLKFSTSNCLSN